MVYDPNKKEEEDLWTRKFIQDYGSKYGITNTDIGWDDPSKSVMLGGESVITPTRVEEGKSYASADAMRQAIDDYAVRQGLSEKKDIVNPYDPKNDYSTKIDELLGSVMDAKKFEYNPETDPLFKAYQKQYGIAGDRSLANTMSQATGITGGRLSSWATSAGQQAKSLYDQQLMSRVPELAGAAYSREQQELANKMGLIGTLGGLDERAYGRGRDVMADERYADEVARELDRQRAGDVRYAEETAYGRERDTAADLRYSKEFDYNKTRDAINDARYKKEFDYKVEQDKISKISKETEIDEETLGAMYFDMMNSEDPTQWLVNESKYMTNDELKALEKLLPKEASDLIGQIIAGAYAAGSE